MPGNVQIRQSLPNLALDVPRPETVLADVSGDPAGNGDGVVTHHRAGEVPQVGNVREGGKVCPGVGRDVQHVDGDGHLIIGLSSDQIDAVLLPKNKKKLMVRWGSNSWLSKLNLGTLTREPLW